MTSMELAKIDRVNLREFGDSARRNGMTQTREKSAVPAAMSGMFHCKEGFVSGTPIFVGTRVPLKNLFDYLAGGHSLDEFLYDFPGVSREQAVGTLDMARETLENIAYETAA